jgi:hypothetical protein
VQPAPRDASIAATLVTSATSVRSLAAAACAAAACASVTEAAAGRCERRSEHSSVDGPPLPPHVLAPRPSQLQLPPSRAQLTICLPPSSGGWRHGSAMTARGSDDALAAAALVGGHAGGGMGGSVGGDAGGGMGGSGVGGGGVGSSLGALRPPKRKRGRGLSVHWADDEVCATPVLAPLEC